jgi:hypothetical protein
MLLYVGIKEQKYKTRQHFMYTYVVLATLSVVEMSWHLKCQSFILLFIKMQRKVLPPLKKMDNKRFHFLKLHRWRTKIFVMNYGCARNCLAKQLTQLSMYIIPRNVCPGFSLTFCLVRYDSLPYLRMYICDDDVFPSKEIE